MGNTKDRRNFLKLLLAGGTVGTIVSTTEGQEVSPATEKVKMLAEDGTLVEIDKAILDRIKSGKKASNNMIKGFIKPSK